VAAAAPPILRRDVETSREEPAVLRPRDLLHRFRPSGTPGATNPFVLNASLVGWLTVLFLWIGAAYFLFQMRKTTALPAGP